MEIPLAERRLEFGRRWLLRIRARLGRLVAHAVMLVVSLACLLPLIWITSSSFKPKQELYAAIPSLFPRQWTLLNWEWCISIMGPVLNYLKNSCIITFGGMGVQIAAATLAGFAFARLEFKGRDLLFYLLLGLMFLPRAGGLMAAYEMMHFLHLRNSYLGLILAHGASLSVPVFIMRQSFLAIPRELEDSAVIDGASTLELLWHIALPMGSAGVVIIAIFAFVAIWGDYLFTWTMLDSQKLYTVAVGITSTIGWSAEFQRHQISTYGANSAAYLISMLPVIIVFVALQRWFIRGLTEGILKL
ncbi:MAG: carbohydrate ABC transporter permease [Anaerolineae bacterium]|nr:carbohydrate ABC transporter permease [Anaerolineae bacterium]